MAEKSGPIYEVRVFVDRDAVADCDAWLEEHVRETLRVAAVTDCYVSSMAADEAGRAGRICHYTLQDDDALDDFLGTFSAQIEHELSSRFSDQVPRLQDLESAYQRMWKFYVLALTRDPQALEALRKACAEEFPGAVNVLEGREESLKEAPSAPWPAS